MGSGTLRQQTAFRREQKVWFPVKMTIKTERKEYHLIKLLKHFTGETVKKELVGHLQISRQSWKCRHSIPSLHLNLTLTCKVELKKMHNRKLCLHLQLQTKDKMNFNTLHHHHHLIAKARLKWYAVVKTQYFKTRLSISSGFFVYIPFGLLRY